MFGRCEMLIIFSIILSQLLLKLLQNDKLEAFFPLIGQYLLQILLPGPV